MSDDSSLSALLRRGDPATSFGARSDSAFLAAVHERIRAADTASPAPHLLPRWLARHALPLAAALAVIASLAAGGGLAYAREQRVRSEIFAAAYVRSIDPWLMHAGQTSGLASEAGHEHR